MELNDGLKGLMDAESKLRSPQGISSPTFLSEQMQRLALFAGAVEERLAEYERDFDLKEAQTYKSYLVDRKLTTTAAERLVKSDLATERSQIKYLSRIVSSAWKQCGVAQSRINHLTKQSETTNL